MAIKRDESQMNFDLLFKNHPIPMWIYDLTSLAFIEVNNAAVKKYGYSRKKFLSMTLNDIRHSEEVKALKKKKSKKDTDNPSFLWRHIADF